MRLLRAAGRLLLSGVGALVAAIALLSPLEQLSASMLWAHMVQHQALMVVAAPLVVAGRPLLLLLGALSRPLQRGLAGWRRAGPIERAARTVAHPVTGTLAFALALWAWHVPALYQAALASDVMHAAEHASFLGGGLLFWWTLLHHRTDAGFATVCLFVTAAHAGLLGVLLTLSPSTWYPAQAGAESWSLTPLEDQQLAGLVMWVPSGLAFVAGALALFRAWLGEAEWRVNANTRHPQSVAGPIAMPDLGVTERNGRDLAA